MRLIFCLLLLTVPALAQVIPATTADGRKVTLNADGTWRFTPDADAGEASLQLEGKLIFQSGDVKPVARATFVLLDAEPGELMRKAGLKPPSDMSNLSPDLATQLLLAFTAGVSSKSLCPKCPQFYEDARNAFAPHLVKTVTTDFDGKASVEGVKPGSYYLFGVYGVARNAISWRIAVTLKPGKNAILIDQKNSLFTL